PLLLHPPARTDRGAARSDRRTPPPRIHPERRARPLSPAAVVGIRLPRTGPTRSPAVKFYHKKRRPPTLAIVSLIDILAILLIFFIVTTTFKTEESLVKVSLPRSAEMAKERSGERRVALALDKEGRVSLG